MNRTILIILLIMTLLMAACSNDAEPTASTQESSGTNADNTVSAPELSQTYTSDGESFPEGLTFQYPDGWVVSTPINNIILIAPSESVANKTFGMAPFDAGEVAIQLGLNTRTNSDEEATEHVSSFAGGIGIPLGNATAMTVAGHPAARVDGANDARHLMVVSILFEDVADVAIGSDDTYIDVVTYTNPDDFSQMEATLLAIIETINLSQ